MVVLRNVLVATDFSDPSAVALSYGREFARTFGAALHVLHVVESLMAAAGVEFYAGSMPEMQRSLEAAAQRQLDAVLTDEDRSQLGAKAIVRTWAKPAPAIAQYAQEADIDLILMGTHGRGALAHLVMGSVAERLVRIAPCPVLTVRHPEREFIRPDALAIATCSTE
jgi:nucleotide-binding universal stress UspA family protein